MHDYYFLLLDFSATKKHRIWMCLLPSPIENRWFLWSMTQPSLNCIRTSSSSSLSCARRNFLNQLHLENLPLSAATSVHVELTVLKPNFLDKIVMSPFPIIRTIPEWPLPSLCTPCDPSAQMHALLSLSIEIIRGINLLAHKHLVRWRNPF